MNAIMPYMDRAYGSPALRGARDIEYDALSRVTGMLKLAPRECGCERTIAAVARNNELWTVLATDLAHPANGIEDRTKAGLLSLAMFSLRHGQAVLGGKGSTEVLIDINLAVMRGLRGEGAA
ncbi:MAG TPA: flagellar biosynthesis regulator FlaF [Paracoccus sp. (in: a-proteobacteria)]|uniref:flagellar biosynthesis regulator FlaF n=1 Tax=Paracoccus sp. TaxID=267 RepID=UPI002BD94AE1|nr:flagellar biosynthesis regulator FlaF [Paracoccus sp. (in: a-proteobacteria)]HWL57260.1 flagellar biosynthesis regulator FlaF [Paracoccus sp. (in: a-proteobacteria)]